MKKIVVGIAVVFNKKILILRRKTDDFLGGYWEIPGGKLEKNETLEEAANRELAEETGLIATSLKITVGGFEYQTKSGTTEQINLLADVDETNVDSIKLLEHDSFAWVAINDLDQYKLSSEMRSCIEQILSISNKI